MNVLVTGGAGFIGQYVVRSLIAEEYSVTVFDDFSSNRSDARSLEGLGATVVAGDVTEPEQVRTVFEATDFWGTIHLAADRSVQNSISHPRRSLLTNAFGSYTVFVNAARNGCTRIVFSSSAAVYGDVSMLPITEAAPAIPLSPYGIEKLASEHYLRNIVSDYRIDGFALRLFNVFGAGDIRIKDSQVGVVSEFVYQATEYGKITIYGSGQQTRDFVHVADVSCVVASVLKSEVNGFEILNVGSGRSVAIAEVAEIVRQAIGSSIQIEFAEPREGDIEHSQACSDRIAETLNWSPSRAVEEAIYDTVAAISVTAQSDSDKSSPGCDAS